MGVVVVVCKDAAKTGWSLENPEEARQQLLRKMVALFVKRHDVIGIVLYGDFSVFVEGDASSREISQALKENLRAQSGTESQQERERRGSNARVYTAAHLHRARHPCSRFGDHESNIACPV
jgi:hypothetical protein